MLLSIITSSGFIRKFPNRSGYAPRTLASNPTFPKANTTPCFGRWVPMTSIFHPNSERKSLGTSRRFFSNASQPPDRQKKKAEAFTDEQLNVLEEAAKLLLKGELEKCVEVCTRHLKTNSSFSLLLSTRGEAFHHLGRLHEAKEDYESALRCDPQSSVAWKRLGLLFYDQAVGISPARSTADLSEEEQAAAIQRSDLLKLAHEHVTKAIEYDKSDADSQCALGLILMELKDVDGAVKEFERATKTDPDFLPAYRYLARIAHQRSQWQAAITFYTHFMKKFGIHYTSLISQHSDSALFCDTVLNRGICYLQIGDLESATIDFTAVISVEGDNIPGRDWAHHFRGRVYFTKEDWTKVIEDNDAALKINPLLLNAYKDRAIAYDMLDRTEKAEEDRKMYLRLKQRMAFEGQLPTHPQTTEKVK